MGRTGIGGKLRRVLIAWSASSAMAVFLTAPAAAETRTDSRQAQASPTVRRHMVLTGRVKVVGISQLEPGAMRQVTYYLETGGSGPAAEPALVIVAQPNFSCTDGARATVEGDFSPAETPFPPMLFSPKILACDGVPVRP